jgi:hypothetical protein
MKSIIAYALVVIGIPYFIGNLFAMIFSFPSSLIIGISRGGKKNIIDSNQGIASGTQWSFRGGIKMDIRDRIAHIFYDIFSGFGNVLTAWFIFYLFSLSPGVAVFFIIVVWEIILHVRNKQSYRQLFGSLGGIVVGWFVVLWLCK